MSATTIDALLRERHEDLRRLDKLLQRRQIAVIRQANEKQSQVLRHQEIGKWGSATRERLLLLLGHGARELALAQSEELGVGLHRSVLVSQRHSASWLRSLDRAYLGSTSPFAWTSKAWAAKVAHEHVASRLRTFLGSFQRYGAAIVLDVERTMAKIPLGASWSEVRDAVAKATAAHTQGRAWMVERIVRTEASQAYNSTSMRVLMEEDTPTNPMRKKLVAVHDAATGPDSYMLDGQIRPVKEPFYDAYHGFSYMHPPNRPNDREIVVGWRGSYGDDRKARGKRAEKPLPEPKDEKPKEPPKKTAAKTSKKATKPTSKPRRSPRQVPPKPTRATGPARRAEPKVATVKAPATRSEKVTQKHAKEIEEFRRDREALLAASAEALGEGAVAELATLMAREKAATKGKRGVTPAGKIVKDIARSQAQRDAWVESLTVKERQAVYDWSTEQWYGQMRMVDSGRDSGGSLMDVKAGRRREAELTIESERKLVAFREALAKAPRYEGEVSRGLRDLPRSSSMRKALETEGAEIELEAVSSWSTDETVARGFAADGDGSYLLVVKTKRGAVISDQRTVVVAAEAEVMIDKGARFRVVTSQKRKGDMRRRVVVLEELDPA